VKIRSGFVSNSSTSSFILIVTEDAHQGVLKHIPEEYHPMLNYGFRETKVFGRPARVFTILSDHGGSYSSMCLEYCREDISFPCPPPKIQPEGMDLPRRAQEPECEYELKNAYEEILKIVAPDGFFSKSIGD